MEKHRCLLCNFKFLAYVSSKRKFCSKACADKQSSIRLKGRSATWMIGKIPWNKGKEGLRREKNGNWKGGEYMNMGYIYSLMQDHPLSRKNGYVLRARLIIEKYLGRVTTKKESPHHKNKKRDDDRIKNLILYKDKATHNRADKGQKIPLSDIIFDGAKRRK